MKALWAIAVSMAALGTAHGQEVSVTLSPPKQEVIQGSAPRFQVLVRANDHVRMLDFGSRLDLRDRLVKPRFVQAEDLSDVPVHLSEQRPVEDSDYVVLEKGNTMLYETNGAPLDLAWLPPGNYVLQLRLKTDWGARFVESNRANFRVVPRSPK